MMPLFLLWFTKLANVVVHMAFFRAVLLMSFFFFEAQTATVDGAVVSEKYSIQASATVSFKEADDAGVSSIVEEAREFRSRKMKQLLTRHPVYVYVADRGVEELDISVTTTGDRKLEASSGGDDSLKMRSRVSTTTTHDFVAFSADYHIPKPHPPRNN